MIYPLCDCPGVVELEIFSHDVVNSESLLAALTRARSLLRNATDTLVLVHYSAPFDYKDHVVNILNDFALSVTNPVVLCTNQNFNTAPTLFFTVSMGRYFEYESKTVWQQFGKTQVDFVASKSKKYLFASQKDIPTRKFVLANLVNNGHITDGYIGYNRKVVSDHSYELGHHNHVVADYNQTIDNIFPLPDIEPTGEWVNMPQHLRTDSYLNIVTDTFYNLESNTLFLSEKIFNAMVFGQMFVYLGPSGSLQYLKDQGYHTFEDCIDQSYDKITDAYSRLTAFTASVLEFVRRPLLDISKIYQKNQPQLLHNRHKVFNSDFMPQLQADLESARLYKTK